MNTSAPTLTPPVDKYVVEPNDLEEILDEADDGRSLLSQPLAQMLIEIRTESGFGLSTMSVGLSRSALIQPATNQDGDDVIGVALHDTAHSPMVLARFLGVTQHSPTRSSSLSPEVVRVEKAAIENLDEPANVVDLLSALADRNCDESTSSLIAMLLISRRASWQISCTTSATEPGGEGSEGKIQQLTALDAGPGGLWIIDINGDTVQLTPVSPRTMYERIVELYPRVRKGQPAH